VAEAQAPPAELADVSPHDDGWKLTLQGTITALYST
jgi:hypothetical protein